MSPLQPAPTPKFIKITLVPVVSPGWWRGGETSARAVALKHTHTHDISSKYVNYVVGQIQVLLPKTIKTTKKLNLLVYVGKIKLY